MLQSSKHLWQNFKVAVDENESLSMVHKLNCLINSLEGIAYKTLEGLEIKEKLSEGCGFVEDQIRKITTGDQSMYEGIIEIADAVKRKSKQRSGAVR